MQLRLVDNVFASIISSRRISFDLFFMARIACDLWCGEVFNYRMIQGKSYTRDSSASLPNTSPCSRDNTRKASIVSGRAVERRDAFSWTVRSLHAWRCWPDNAGKSSPDCLDQRQLVAQRQLVEQPNALAVVHVVHRNKAEAARNPEVAAACRAVVHVCPCFL